MYVGEELTCEATIHFMLRYLDGDLGELDETLVDAHLRYCRGCTRKFRFERRVIDGLRARLRTVATPAALRTRIAHLLEDM
ncbi:MAG TPA: zf-HC2 domain-containing protein [Gemmatimonadales bacterium]|nr:zf-HC2 domain-containing protein [Gemmatimonadales bacterium]